MVGIRSFPFGSRPILRGYVSFRECKDPCNFPSIFVFFANFHFQEWISHDWSRRWNLFSLLSLVFFNDLTGWRFQPMCMFLLVGILPKTGWQIVWFHLFVEWQHFFDSDFSLETFETNFSLSGWAPARKEASRAIVCRGCVTRPMGHGLGLISSQ